MFGYGNGYSCGSDKGYKCYKGGSSTQNHTDCYEEKCDCCCVPGIAELLKAFEKTTTPVGLIVKNVTNAGTTVVVPGTIVSVDCDIVRITLVGTGLFAFPVGTTISFSVCDVVAVAPLP